MELNKIRINIDGEVKVEEYQEIRKYISGLPLKLGNNDEANVDIFYQAEDISKAKTIIISPWGDSFGSISNNSMGENTLKYDFYTNGEMHFTYGEDTIIVKVYNKLEENKLLKSRISDLEEILKRKSQA